jgi:hypothetical protein
MVQIKLMSFFKGIAEILCFPDGHEDEQFTLVLDVYNQEIIENSLNEKGNPYVIHAAWKMYNEFAEKGMLPETTFSIWC